MSLEQVLLLAEVEGNRLQDESDLVAAKLTKLTEDATVVQAEGNQVRRIQIETGLVAAKLATLTEDMKYNKHTQNILKKRILEETAGTNIPELCKQYQKIYDMLKNKIVESEKAHPFGITACSVCKTTFASLAAAKNHPCPPM